MFLRPVYQLLAYYLTLLFFGMFGAEICLVALLAGVLPATERMERGFQRLIHRHFGLFHWWCRFARLIYVRSHGFERLPRGGLVLVANHPSLIDITCLLANLPEAVCIFKPAIRRNPVLGAAARRAGYLANDGGPDLVRAASEKLAAGHLLIVFPEGTRTAAGEKVGPIKPGFALMAQRARVPVQLVRIATNSDVLTKGRAWWKLPRIPVYVDITLGPLIPIGAEMTLTEQTARIEAWFRDPASSVGLPP